MGIHISLRRRSRAGFANGARPGHAGSGRGSPWFLSLFGLPFLLFGLIGGYFIGLRPILKVHDARGWAQVPAEVVSSAVGRNTSSDGTTYRVEITFAYEWEGLPLTSDRYNFSTAYSSGHDGKREIVRRYPPGHRFQAYVNPANPSEAVINPAMEWIYFLMAGFTGIFLLAGLGLVGAGMMQFRSRGAVRGETAAVSTPEGDRFAPGTIPEPNPLNAQGNVVLPPETGRWTPAIGLTFFALFWNGIVSIFLVQVVNSWRAGAFEVFLGLFLIPFVAVGLGLIGAAVYFFLAGFNPRARLWIRPGRARPGKRFTLGWEFSGPAGRLEAFTLYLEGVEKATYRQGTNTYTDEHVFHRQALARIEDKLSIASGKTEVMLPIEAIHSLDAPNNKIVWRFRIHGAIRRWPDIRMNYPFVLLPQTATPQPKP
ncbi:MAG: DUF3592 domain-containing protein [Puniceicoccaceae bacterium]|nr:MAG: DUF3592 domain-containing protein [Puniceicoccaceae bacterium]